MERLVGERREPGAAARVKSVVVNGAAALLGLLAGAMLLIAVALVPWWQSLEPTEFARWFREHSPAIGRLMLPLGAGGAALACTAAGLTRRRDLWVAAALAVFTVATYPLYFAAANAAIAGGNLESSQIAAELARWRTWHWLRTVAGLSAFLIALRRA